MTEVDAARRARERGNGRTWRERALAAEAEVERLREENKRLSEALSWADADLGAIIRETEAPAGVKTMRDVIRGTEAE